MDIFSILASGMQGAREGMDRRREQSIEDQRLAMDKDSQAMQKRQFELQMKRLGLDLENAQYEHDVKIAQGTPKEVAAAELQARQDKIAMEAEKFGLYKRLTESQIDENTAQAERARRPDQVKQTKDTTYADAQKVIDGQIKFLNDRLSDPAVAADKNLVAQITGQITSLGNQREILMNSQLAELGLPMGAGEGQFGLGADAPAGGTQPDAAPTQPFTPETARYAPTAAIASVLQPISQGVSTGTELIRGAMGNTQNINNTPLQNMGIGVSRNIVTDILSKMFAPKPNMMTGAVQQPPLAMNMQQQAARPQMPPWAQMFFGGGAR